MKCLIYVLYCVTMFNVINCQFDDSTYLGDVKLRTIMKIHMLCPDKEFDEIEVIIMLFNLNLLIYYSHIGSSIGISQVCGLRK